MHLSVYLKMPLREVHICQIKAYHNPKRHLHLNCHKIITQLPRIKNRVLYTKYYHKTND